MEIFPMTPSGAEKLSAELKHLKSVVRHTVAKEIEVARAHGDLSENSEYDAAKEKQAFTEARIKDLEGKLSRVRVIGPQDVAHDKVVFGATVTIRDLDSEDVQTFTVVGEYEANLAEGKINISSPVGKALIGKSVGDEVTINTPKGPRVCEILELKFVAV